MKGSRKAVLCFWDGSDDFGESTLPVCLQSQTPGISQAVPLSLRKNAKGGGQSAQLAFGSDKCRLSTNAFSHELRGNHARKIMRLSLEADRQLVVAVRRKRKEGCGGRRGIGGSQSLRGTLRAPRQRESVGA